LQQQQRGRSLGGRYVAAGGSFCLVQVSVTENKIQVIHGD
jgi:hypothetical protein